MEIEFAIHPVITTWVHSGHCLAKKQKQKKNRLTFKMLGFSVQNKTGVIKKYRFCRPRILLSVPVEL